ncbi:hypothetical protein ONS96_011634 [Cadophora gregata f. sp. sojae]|nr:hypothetical protein ONS96_011634 [Cadophora gregata f. sp. sojae]
MPSSNTSDYPDHVKYELARREGIKMDMDPEPVDEKKKKKRKHVRPKTATVKSAKTLEAEGYEPKEAYEMAKTNNEAQRRQGRRSHDPDNPKKRLVSQQNNMRFQQPAPGPFPHNPTQKEAYTPPHLHRPRPNTLSLPQTPPATESQVSPLPGLSGSHWAGSEEICPPTKTQSTTNTVNAETSEHGSAAQNAMAEVCPGVVEDRDLKQDSIEVSIIEKDTVEVEQKNGEEEKVDEGIFEGEKSENGNIGEILSGSEGNVSPKMETSEFEQQPQVSIAEHEELKQQLTTLRNTQLNLQLQYNTVEQRANQQQKQLEGLQKTNTRLEGRLASWISMDKHNQDQLKENAVEIEKLKRGKTTFRELMDKARQELHDFQRSEKRDLTTLNNEVNELHLKLKKAKSDLISEKTNAQAASRLHAYKAKLLNENLNQLKDSQAESSGEIENLNLYLHDLRQRLALEQLAHNEAKAQLADTNARDDGLISQLEACKTDLQAAKLQTEPVENQVRDLKIATEKRRAEVKDVGVQVEKYQGRVAEHLSPRPAKGGKNRNWQSRNRRFDPTKEARQEQDEKNKSSALVLFRPPRSLEQKAFQTIRETIMYACLAQMGMDDLVYHDFNLIKFCPDWHCSFHRSVPYRAINASPHSIESAADTKVVKIPQPKTRTRAVEAPKPIPNRATEFFSFAAQFIIYGTAILLFISSFLPDARFQHSDHENARFVSAAPSREVFNSTISVVDTTCPWETPRPSALVLVASSSLIVVEPLVAESELFWIDTKELTGNCSASDRDTQEQITGDDTCSNSRQDSERRIAIGIVVTVVVPAVVISGLAHAFGYL